MYVAQADLKLATLPPQPPTSQVYRLHCLLYDVIMANDSMARVSTAFFYFKATKAIVRRHQSFCPL